MRARNNTGAPLGFRLGFPKSLSWRRAPRLDLVRGRWGCGIMPRDHTLSGESIGQGPWSDQGSCREP